MIPDDQGRAPRVDLSRSQRNIYNGVLQDGDPALYLIGRSYRFHPLDLTVFLAALQATILRNPVQLSVLEAPPTGFGYPSLSPRLQFDDIVRVRSEVSEQRNGDSPDLTRTWASGILAKPLVRYTVWIDESGAVSGLDVHTHHLLIDGGATGLIEADLARHLAPDRPAEFPSALDGIGALARAHQREALKTDEALERFGDALRQELAEEARHGGYGHSATATPATAARGLLRGSVQICGTAYDALHELSEHKRVPLNVLVAAAAVAVHASLQQSAESLLIHAVDNRFGEPDLNVASCLVNSVAHPVRFPPFASVQDVVQTLDRGYVKAVRRRWLREEQYRRVYLATHRTSHVDSLTLNFLREPCAPGLRPYLLEPPVTTDIGPVESLTVASVLDAEQRVLHLGIWNRADLSGEDTPSGVAERIAAVLESMTAMWHSPIAMTVGEWFGIGAEGQRHEGPWAIPTERSARRAWFLDPAGGVRQTLARRAAIPPLIAWLVGIGVHAGDVLVFTDDNTDTTLDLMIACHLAGCGYSICDTQDEVHPRVAAITEYSVGGATHSVDMAAARLATTCGGEFQEAVGGRMAQVAGDAHLAARTAYIMPTSGSTGRPKLVRVPHESLALFCDAAAATYGWGPHDTVLQCAPLTSDISVEEVFCAAICGSELVRSAAMRSGDLQALAQDLLTKSPTVADLPTAVWHLLCDDPAAIDAIRRSRLRQIVIGGEAIRPAAVAKWVDSIGAQSISLISTYGPTETTVIATVLPVACDGTVTDSAALRRLGRPIVPNSVAIAFGEVVILGDLVSAGYLGIAGAGFGTVTTPAGSRCRAFATADRVSFDDDGFPVITGRRDAIVKISGRRVDTAEVIRRISEDPAVSDVAVEVHDGRLGVWVQTARTRSGAEDSAAAARVRRILVSLAVSSFFVIGVPTIPRRPNGGIDAANLRTLPRPAEAGLIDSGISERATGLATIWARHLGRAVGPDASLLDEGVGSLDLIRILPDTRRFLSRHVSILDLISADTAANLVRSAPTGDAWMDLATATEIEQDLAAVGEPPPPAGLSVRRSPGSLTEPAIVVLGASGILGTGFARALLELEQSGVRCPPVVLVTRSDLPDRAPWTGLDRVAGVRLARISADPGPAEFDVLVAGAGTVVNCIGTTNVLVPYRELRRANVELVSTLSRLCASSGTRLVHLSTSVVTADVTAPRVTDPRDAPYPYAASKALAELAVAGSARPLDFTIVRLPRVLGDPAQLTDSADILVSIVDACVALQAYPAVTLTEEVTTGGAAAKAILGLLSELTDSSGLGRGITVLRGEAVNYAEFLSEFACEETDPMRWKQRLDQSDWAQRNPRRWSVVDAWITLGMRLGERSYSDFLATSPTIGLDVDSVAELGTETPSLPDLLQSFTRRG